jgi:parallel beta-helix repeat protein
MKTIFLTIVAIILMYTISSAQTPIPGGNVSGTWTLTGSPYLIEGNIIVPDGQTLIVEPGVQIRFDGQYKFDIQGKILAIGNSANMITFTATDTTVAKWSGIRFDHTSSTNDTSVFHYCTIEYSDSGAIYSSFFSKIKISNSTISYNTDSRGAGIFLTHAGGLFTGNTFSNNCSKGDTTCYGGAIYIYSCDNFCNILNNTFTSNSVSASASSYGINYANAYGGVIYIDSTKNVNIKYNIFNSNLASAATSGGCYVAYANTYGGVICIDNSEDVNIEYNTFTSNSASNSASTAWCWGTGAAYANTYGGGIYINGSNNINVPNNTFTSNSSIANASGSTVLGGDYAYSYGGGIYINGSNNINIPNNTFTSNSVSATTSSDGGGIFIDNSNLTITNNSFTSNIAINDGGAISINNCSNSSNICKITDNTFTLNSAANGGGFFIYGSGNINLINNNFNQNMASSSGGGIYTNSSSIINITSDTLSSNSAANGGGIFITGSSEINIAISKLNLNTASSSGGGLCIQGSSEISMINNNINTNNASTSGGGIYIEDSYVYLKDIYISSNTAANEGGGVCINNSVLNLNTNPFFNSNIISDNNVSSGSGSGIYLHLVNPKLYNNIVSGNNFTNSGNGGGIYLDNSNAKIINNAIIYNAANGDGGGIFFTNGSSPLLANSILYGNTCASHYQLFINDNNSAPIIIYCDVQYDSVGLAPGVTYNQANCTNNIGSDPAFVNFAIENYHLLSTSPCINAGTPDTTGLNLPAIDLDGNLRVYNGRIDIGPYEYGSIHGIGMNDFNNHLLFYPNPATDKLTIETSAITTQSQLSIINPNGQELITQQISNPKTVIDISNLPSGVYFVRLTNDRTVEVGKIIKQ